MSVFVEEVPNPLIPVEFEYDRAIVGSSPLSVVNALLEHFQGRKVIVLEARGVVGGAWAGDTVCGMSGIDIGSHNLCISEKNAQFLEKFFGVKCLQIGVDEYLPEGGCARMSERLVQVAKNAGIAFQTNCKVEKATLMDVDVWLDCLDLISMQPLQIKAKKVVKPTYAAFEVYRKAEKISQPIKTVRKQHLYFIVKDSSVSKGYSLEEMLSSSIHRIADLTKFVNLEDESHRMFVAELRKEMPADLELVSTKCEQIVKLLQKKDHLSSEAQIIKCDSRTFTYSSVIVPTTPDDLDKFERLPTDFIENLQYYVTPFAELGDMSFLRLQKCFPERELPGSEDFAAVS